MQEVKVFCPATVSNVGPGFDLLGFAVDQPGDELLVRCNDEAKLRLFNESESDLPLSPEENIAAISAQALLDDLDSKQGFDLVFLKKINPGSGLGSSAASCVAAVVGVNELLGSPYDTPALLPFAMEGEQCCSGSYHADNVAPALLGGFTLIRSYDPLDIKHIPYPSDLYCALVHPDLEFKTSEGRKVIPQEVSLKTALTQAGNLAGLIAGLTTSDYGLISRSVKDVFAEPYRTKRLPEFEELRAACLEAGSIGTGLSGSGPTIFSICRSAEQGRIIQEKYTKHFEKHGIRARTYVARISEAGCRISK